MRYPHRLFTPTHLGLAVGGLLGLAGCEAREPTATPATAASAPLAAATPVAGEQVEAEPARCGACGSTGGPVADPGLEHSTDPETGAPLRRAGGPLQGLPLVAVPTLLAHPENYAGKTVRVEGDVAAMCHHRRVWFALQQIGDREGRTVRVFGAPAFLVPPGSVGSRARAEGRVELIELPPRARDHLADEHGLQEPPSQAVVLRATGAEFL